MNDYEGRPTDSQVARTDVLSRELEDVVREFTNLAGEQLPSLNNALAAKNLPPINMIAEPEWQKAQDNAGE